MIAAQKKTVNIKKLIISGLLCPSRKLYGKGMHPQMEARLDYPTPRPYRPLRLRYIISTNSNPNSPSLVSEGKLLPPRTILCPSIPPPTCAPVHLRPDCIPCMRTVLCLHFQSSARSILCSHCLKGPRFVVIYVRHFGACLSHSRQPLIIWHVPFVGTTQAHHKGIRVNKAKLIKIGCELCL